MTKPHRKVHILLSAFACDPVTGSEPYVGWSWANLLARDYKVTVLTRSYSKDLIDSSGISLPFEVIYFDLPGIRSKNHYWRFIKIYYVIWQFLALFKLLTIARNFRFDFIHHLTYNVVDMPGFLWLIPGTKFIWGPVGGGQLPPNSLKEVYGPGWYKQQIRAVMKHCARWNPIIRLATRKASHVFFANKETAALISPFANSASILLETAIDPKVSVRPASAKSGYALWLGNVIDRKALIIAIEAYGKLATDKRAKVVPLVIAGDGPMLAAAKKRAAELQILDRVSFLGRVPYGDVDELMSNASFFIFTSVQDTSGNVVLEAMAQGKPVIALDHHGVSEMITARSGIKIQVKSFSSVVDEFAAAIQRLSCDTTLREKMSSEALSLVRSEHSWTARYHAYCNVINNLAQKN